MPDVIDVIDVIYDIYDIYDMYGALTYTICQYGSQKKRYDIRNAANHHIYPKEFPLYILGCLRDPFGGFHDVLEWD